MNRLEKARMAINEADETIVKALEKRMNAVKEVALWKMENGMPVLDQSREAQVLERNAAMLENQDYEQVLLGIYDEILRQSRNYQKTMMAKDTAAYAGTEGAFSHMVCQKLYPDHKLMACSSFDEVFNAVENNQAEVGVIPLENTSSGLVGEVMDLLMTRNVYVIRVADQQIEQCLLGLPDASLKDIEWVYSKDQALHQSKEFLDALHVKTVPYPNTAMAAQFVARDQDKTKAAIAAKENAAIYGLKILASQIQTERTNTTRFLVISKNPPAQFGDHFSMVLSVQDEPGCLARAIEVVSASGLNMDTLQSRPIKDRPFEYFFYIQCTGEMTQQRLAALEKELLGVCRTFRFLGSYELEPSDQNN